MMPRKQHLLVLTIAILCCLSGCDHDKHPGDLKKYISELKKTAEKNNTKTTLAELHTTTPLSYKAKNLRSPFESSSYTGNSNVTLPPLRTFPLNMLRFTGTVTRNNETEAYVLAPDNNLYQVKLGDMIGDHYGKITKLYPDRIEIEESVDTSTDGTSIGKAKKIVTLQLKDAS